MARKRAPFDTHTDILVNTGSKKSGGHRKVTLGGPPKKVSKRYRRILVRMAHENPDEFNRQCSAVGALKSEVLAKRSSKK